MARPARDGFTAEVTTASLAGLPAGLTTRPLRMSDSRAVFEVMAAQEQHDVGAVEIEEADIIGDWQRPSFQVEASTVGVFEEGQLVAYGEVSGSQRCDAAVHPAYRGRGIGTAVAQWIRQAARGRGESVVGMPVPQGSPGDRLLEALGYAVRWTSWVLELPADRRIEEQPLPAGHVIRTAEGEDDHRAAWEVVEDAFLEWAARERESYADFAARHTSRPGFEPWNLRLVVDSDGEVVGVCFVLLAGDEGFVDQLAVRRDRRGLGLARALLADAFANARAHGATRATLSTDSRTGALQLYQRVGMEVTSTWVHRAISL